MTIVRVTENPLDPESWERHETDDLRVFLRDRFPVLPETARVYHRQVSEADDVTPTDDTGIARLRELPGPFYVVVYPAGQFAIPIIIAAISFAAAVAMSLIFKPRLPTVAARNAQGSANNDLSERSNTPRLYGRIPDILGTVRSVPDLLAQPYRVFESHVEIEYSFLCVGRGSYEVARATGSRHDIRDSSTLLELIEGAGLRLYGPYTSPNAGAPQLDIGTAFDERLQSAKRCDSVNGQTLLPPNRKIVVEGNNIRFRKGATDADPCRIELRAPVGAEQPGYGFTDLFGGGDVITIEEGAGYGTVGADGAWWESVQDPDTLELTYRILDPWPIDPGTGAPLPAGTYDGETYTVYPWGPELPVVYIWFLRSPLPISLTGTYRVVPDGAGDKLLLITAPGGGPCSEVNAGWLQVDSTARDSQYTGGTISADSSRWVGPFLADSDELRSVYANVVAPSGSYKNDGTNQTARNVEVQIEVTPVEDDGETRRKDPNGNEYAIEIESGLVLGSSITTSQRAVTIRHQCGVKGKCLVRMCRVTRADLEFQGTVVDEVRWRDLYAMDPVSDTDLLGGFGDVTTIHAATRATVGALSVKDRKLNLLVTRKLKRFGELLSQDEIDAAGGLDADGFTNGLLPTNRADDILVHVCRDPRIGNRSLAELDVANIYETIGQVEAYFDTVKACEFSYTFDKENLSFEETVAAIAEAVFCTAYRRGSVMKLLFERQTDDSVLLFNHRNIIPGSMTRTYSTGTPNDHDGVEYQWVDPKDDSLVTLYLPRDRSAVNPQKIESIGVRDPLQAYFHANRIWNKQRYQALATEFEATQEADILVLTNRILVADGIQPGCQDGDVRAQDGLTLTLSDPIVFDPGKTYSLFLQHADGTVESVPVTPGLDANQVVLSRAPLNGFGRGVEDLLATDAELFARATYHLVADDDARPRAFLLVKKEPQARFTSTLSAVNYDVRYYAADPHFVTGDVDANGQPTGKAALVGGPGQYQTEEEVQTVFDLLEDLVNYRLRT